MRRADAAWLAAVLVLGGLGLGLKLTAGERFVFPDVARADGELVARMERAGFAAQPARPGMRIAHAFRRGECAVLTAVAGDMGQDLARWTGARRPGETLRFHYRGVASASFPRLRAPIEDQLQRQLARLGITMTRPAVVATIEAGTCAGLLPRLSDVPITVSPPSPIWTKAQPRP